jgi:hypothetical protein
MAYLEGHGAQPPHQEDRHAGTIIHGTRDVRLEDRDDPTIVNPTYAIVRTVVDPGRVLDLANRALLSMSA